MINIEAQILEADGSCRDISFPEITLDGAQGVFHFFNSSFHLEEASDQDGNEYNFTTALARFNSANFGSIHSMWSSTGFISSLQLFLSWQSSNTFFAEVTFFPEDISREKFTLSLFMEFIKELRLAAQSDNFYVRCENASWVHGDTGSTSGVIFSGTDLAIPE